MEVLYFYESIRTPLLDGLMLFITRFGEETLFLVAALIMFWCVDKYKGYYVLSVGFVGTILSQFMKLWFRIPRPWVLDENFTVVDGAKAEAGGYSFPSGHSQNAVGTFGAISSSVKHRWVKAVAIVIAVLVPVSRMYLGVHTPLDVLVGSAIAVVLVFVMKPLICCNTKRNLPYVLVGMTILAVGYTCFVKLYPFPADVDAGNLASGTENAYTLLGALLGFLVVYIVDEKWLNFRTDAVWWAQILKLLLGLLIVLGVKSGLKIPLNMLLGETIGRIARYFLLVIVAGIVWPLTFQWFAGLGNKE